MGLPHQRYLEARAKGETEQNTRKEEERNKRKVPEYEEPTREDPDTRERQECRPMCNKPPPHATMRLLIEGGDLSTIE